MRERSDYGCSAVDIGSAPSVRALGEFASVFGRSGMGAGLVADPVSGVLGGIGEIVKGIASGASTVPSIAAAFGQNKQVKAQEALQAQALQAQEAVSIEQARAGAASSAQWAATAKAAAPYVGGALLLAGAAWGLSKLLGKRGRR